MKPTESDNPAAIDLIEINDVTVSFKDGDKPVFTGSVSENAAYAFRCEWWSLDSDTGITELMNEKQRLTVQIEQYAAMRQKRESESTAY